MGLELTRERLTEALENMRRAAAAEDALDIEPPDFIAEMTHHEICEWDVALYELALEGLRLRGDRCALAQGAHGIVGCGECIECAKWPRREPDERTSSERTIMHLGRIAYDRLAAVHSRALGNAGLGAWWRAEREMARIEEAARSSFKDAIRIVEELRDAPPRKAGL